MSRLNSSYDIFFRWPYFHNLVQNETKKHSKYFKTKNEMPMHKQAWTENQKIEVWWEFVDNPLLKVDTSVQLTKEQVEDFDIELFHKLIVEKSIELAEIQDKHFLKWFATEYAPKSWHQLLLDDNDSEDEIADKMVDFFRNLPLDYSKDNPLWDCEMPTSSKWMEILNKVSPEKQKEIWERINEAILENKRLYDEAKTDRKLSE